MNESVSDVIVMRTRATDGLTPTLVWSVAIHAVLLAAVILLASGPVRQPPREVMTISLGGAPGPRAGGLTQIGGQAAPPTPRPAPPAPVTPPAPRRQAAPSAVRTPTRTAPARVAPPARTPAAPSRSTSTAASTPAPPVTDPGSSPVNTGARGQGFGLSGGGGRGAGVQLDVGNFCCPEYLEQMVTLIQRNWAQNHGVAGSTTMQFTITRDGTLSAITVERSSQFALLDSAADRALRVTQRLPPLPAAFPNPTLTVHMRFDYNR
jgi:TonB family protein